MPSQVTMEHVNLEPIVAGNPSGQGPCMPIWSVHSMSNSAQGAVAGPALTAGHEPA